MFPFVLKKDYQLWHLSRNSHGTACLVTSRAWNGETFKERCALIWQSQNIVQNARTARGSVRFISSLLARSEKAWIRAFVSRRRLPQFITKLRFETGLFSSVQVSERLEKIYQHPHSHTGDLAHSSVALSFEISFFWWIWACPLF